MKQTGKIVIKGNKFPVLQAEVSDRTNIESFCGGFIHGGMISALNNILTGNQLLCSDSLRSLGFPKIKDISKDTPAGKAVYFRFVRNGIKLKNIPLYAGGVGKSGGLYFYMPLNNLIQQKIICFSSTDSGTGSTFAKFGNVVEETCGVWRPRKITNIQQNFKAAAGGAKPRCNNSEIGFYKNVSLDTIKWILNSTDNVEITNGNWEFYDHIKCNEKRYRVYRRKERVSTVSAPSIPSKSSKAG